MEQDGQFCVMSEDGSRSFGCYDTMQEAEERLAQVESFADDDKYGKPKKPRRRKKAVQTVTKCFRSRCENRNSYPELNACRKFL